MKGKEASNRSFKLIFSLSSKLFISNPNLVNKANLEESIIAVTADCTTSLVTGEHESDPVRAQNEVKEFGEGTCAKGGLGRIRGIDLVPTIMNLLGKTKNSEPESFSLCYLPFAHPSGRDAFASLNKMRNRLE